MRKKAMFHCCGEAPENQMSGWQYHLERIRHPITQGDARIESSLEDLQRAVRREPVNCLAVGPEWLQRLKWKLAMAMTEEELKVVVGLVNQHFHREKNKAGEQCVSATGASCDYAAILLLIRYGLMIGLDDFGNRARWTDAGRKSGGMD
jgi:hypothetical protein